MTKISKLTLSRSNSNRGYSLMEISIVLAIISLLLGFGVNRLMKSLRSGEVVAAKSHVTAVSSSLLAYRNLAMAYPTQEQGLKALVQKPTTDPKPKQWDNQLAEMADLNDPWGNPLQYVRPAKKGQGDFDLYSWGPDGQDGTEDDIGNW